LTSDGGSGSVKNPPALVPDDTNVPPSLTRNVVSAVTLTIAPIIIGISRLMIATAAKTT
jgi:hypothetical protein